MRRKIYRIEGLCRYVCELNAVIDSNKSFGNYIYQFDVYVKSLGKIPKIASCSTEITWYVMTLVLPRKQYSTSFQLLKLKPSHM
jgi:hypothetical protein